MTPRDSRCSTRAIHRAMTNLEDLPDSHLCYVPGVGEVTLGEVLTAGLVTLLGSGSAAGSLALARRSEDRELLEACEEALGLTEGG